MKKPELLAPAGNLEKCKIAFLYGADACFIGGTVFGLRKYADNFDIPELTEAVKIANELNKKIYVVLNGFAREEDIENLRAYLPILETIKPHAFIISDMGVLALAKELTTIPIHVSTQASITNAATAKFWKEAGASRVILAREVTINETKTIQEEADIECEVFIHGAMCASYSGKCVISNYTSGRDSNRGGCVQSCRHTFQLIHTETQAVEDATSIMNAKDLRGIELLPEIMNAEIDSVKIEGRMKSNLYVANTISAYRQAIDQCYKDLQNHESFDPTPYIKQLDEVSNRGFSTGGLEQAPQGESIHFDFVDYHKSTDIIGTIKSTSPEKAIYIEVKMPFSLGDTLEVLTTNGESHPVKITSIKNTSEEHLEHATQNTIVELPWIPNSHPNLVLKKPLKT